MVRRKQGKVTNPRRVRVVLHLLAGGVVILISVFTDRILSQPPYWGILEFSAFVTGLAIVAIGSISAFPAAILRLSTNFCLSLLSMVVFIALGEVLFRFVKYDFSYEAEAWSRIPIYYRQPIVPTGDVYFRRNGSEHWTGQVLNFRAQQLGVIPNPYKDERVITVEYDYRGFRNPSHVSDWEIAIAGDSFTELGYLPH